MMQRKRTINVYLDGRAVQAVIEERIEAYSQQGDEDEGEDD